MKSVKNKEKKIKKSKGKLKEDISKHENEIEKLKKDLSGLEKIRKDASQEIKKIRRDVLKFKNKYYILIGIGTAVILFSLLSLMTNYEPKFILLKIEFQLKRDVLTNLFFLGLAIFSISFILYQLVEGFFNEVRLELAKAYMKQSVNVENEIKKKELKVNVKSLEKMLLVFREKFRENLPSNVKPLTKKGFNDTIKKMKKTGMIRENLEDEDELTEEETQKINYVLDQETVEKSVIKWAKESMKNPEITETELHAYQDIIKMFKTKDYYEDYKKHFENKKKGRIKTKSKK